MSLRRAFCGQSDRQNERSGEGCPRATATGDDPEFRREINFPAGEDFTLTADLIREELHANGPRRLVEAHAEKPTTTGYPTEASCWPCYASLNWQIHMVPSQIRVRGTGQQIDELARAVNK